MSREILFRGKMIDNEEWEVGGVFSSKNYTGIIVNAMRWVEVDPKTVCQYTGLTDKSGRKIFEGDIITYQHDNDDCPFPNKDTKRRVGRVYFQEFRSCFAVAEGRNGSDRINQDLFKYVQNGNRVEVIGNIFDNPELLEVGE